MLNIGMCSVTFNDKTVAEIIEICKKCGIKTVEWGSDSHAPEGDTENAKKIKKACDEAGIFISSYGSYYRCGTYENSQVVFQNFIDVAKALNASVIRIWSGDINLEDADNEYIDKIVTELQMICDMANAEKLEVGCEFHQNTLCNNRENALAIVEKVARDNLGMYFQYDPYVTVEDNCMTLEKFIPILKNVHVFWIDTKLRRYSLAENEGFEAWKKFCNILDQNHINTNLLFEFMIDPDNPTVEGLQYEYNVLKRIIG